MVPDSFCSPTATASTEPESQGSIRADKKDEESCTRWSDPPQSVMESIRVYTKRQKMLNKPEATRDNSARGFGATYLPRTSRNRRRAAAAPEAGHSKDSFD